MSYDAYKQGIGLVDADRLIYDNAFITGHETLIYSARNGVACGTYLFPDTSAPLAVNSPDYAERAFKVYPNPAQDQLTIETPSAAYKISLVNSVGQLVYYEEKCSGKRQIDVSDLTDGIYFMRIETAEKQYTNRKIVVQHLR
jgi:hypothetical protein